MFREHKIRFESGNLDNGEKVQVCGIRAADSHSTGVTDTQNSEDFALPNSSPSQNERAMVIPGTVTIHGYSMRVFGNFLGGVYQGLSAWDASVIEADKNAVLTHQWDTGASLNTTNLTDLRQEQTVKNHKYLRGWSAANTAGAGGTSQQLGMAHLKSKVSRTTEKYNPKKKAWDHIKKSGFVLVPNTGTEFMSWNIANIAPNGSSFDNRFFYVDLVIWMSFDNT